MSPRTQIEGLSRTSFLVDPSSAERNAGRQIDWDAVTGDDFEDANGEKFVPHGCPVAAAADGRRIRPAVGGQAGNAYGLLEGPAHVNAQSHSLSGYGVVIRGVVYEQLIPLLEAGAKTALTTAGFKFETYADSREDDAIEES